MPAIYMSQPYTGQSFNVNTSFTVKATIDKTGLVSNYSAYGIKFFIDGVSIGIVAVSSNWAATTTYSLSRAGKYSIYGKLVNKSTGAELGYQTGTVTFDIIAPRPSNWSWTSTVSKGSAMPYTKSGKTIYAKPLTASEWNGFIDRIFEFFDYKGVTVSGGGASNFYVTKGNQMSGGELEYAQQLIDAMSPPTATPTRTTRVTAAYVNGLKNSLNSIK